MFRTNFYIFLTYRATFIHNIINRVRIQYCSDLHLEFPQNNRYLEEKPLSVNGDILILAGDIVPLHDEFLNNPFFSIISKKFRQIYWVPGNHEFYYKDIAGYDESFNIRIHGNINIVNNIELNFEGINFIFSTLWSKISKTNEKDIMLRVSDFECITNNSRKFTASNFNKLHAKSLHFIETALSTAKPKTVVVTHHLPSSLCNWPGHNSSPINEAFCVELTSMIERSNVAFWLYGHSHFNQKPLFIGQTILVTNQLGYVQLNEHTDFRHNAFFSI